MVSASREWHGPKCIFQYFLLNDNIQCISWYFLQLNNFQKQIWQRVIGQWACHLFWHFSKNIFLLPIWDDENKYWACTYVSSKSSCVLSNRSNLSTSQETFIHQSTAASSDQNIVIYQNLESTFLGLILSRSTQADLS